MSTSIFWELTCNGLVSHPGGDKDSYLLNTNETGSIGHLRHKEFSSGSYV